MNTKIYSYGVASKVDMCYKESTPSKATICRWSAESKRDRTGTNDAERFGPPNESVTTRDIKKFTIVLSNHIVKVCYIDYVLNIAIDHFYLIFH